MKITDLSDQALRHVGQDMIFERADGSSEEGERQILHECHLQVYINETLSMNIVCTATDLPEMLLGHLYSEGRITDPAAVEQIYVCEDAARARIYTREPIPLPAKPLEIRSCNCGEDGLLCRYDTDRTPLPDFDFDPSMAVLLADAFSRGAPLHDLTGGIHSCFLAFRGELRYVCEDIGRHNALDKAIGCALRDGLPLSQCVCLTSGRVPADMMEKTIRSGIPVLLSNASPTDAAVELARRYHVRLICHVRPGRWQVFSSPELWESE